MTARRLLRELGYPLSNTVVLLSIVTFSLLVTLARASGLVGIVLGIILLPALFRYLLMLLEARAYGRTPPVASLELFSIVENFWTLAPLMIIALSIWGGYWLDQNVSPMAAQAFSVMLLAIAPASLAVLAITQSAAQALNPAAVARMLRVLGWSYSLVPAVVALVAVPGSHPRPCRRARARPDSGRPVRRRPGIHPDGRPAARERRQDFALRRRCRGGSRR